MLLIENVNDNISTVFKKYDFRINYPNNRILLVADTITTGTITLKLRSPDDAANRNFLIKTYSEADFTVDTETGTVSRTDFLEAPNAAGDLGASLENATGVTNLSVIIE